ncbi:hypothetical protein ACO3VM_02845 [Methanocaldococcus sp. 10A]
MCVEVNYSVAAQVHKKVYGMEISPDEIKEQVKEVQAKSSGLLNEKGAFRMWLKDLNLDKEYDKAIKQVRTMNGQNGVAMEKKVAKNATVKRRLEKKITINVDDELMFIENLMDTPDLVEIFGPSGSGKTQLTFAYAVNKAQYGHKTMFIDLEGNTTEIQRKVMEEHGVRYKRIKGFESFYGFVERINEHKDFDYIFIDSLGLRALGIFCRENQRGKGDILMKIQDISEVLKDFAEGTGTYVILTNQATSEMGANGHVEYYPTGYKKHIKIPDWGPWGDKHTHFVKEILQSVLVERVGNTSVCDFMTHRSRFFPWGFTIARIKVKLQKSNGTLEQVIEVEELI